MEKNIFEDTTQKENADSDLRNNISELILIELEKKRADEPHDATLVLVDPDKISNDDINIYAKYVDKSLMLDEFNDYRKKNVTPFAGWIANKLGSHEWQKRLRPAAYEAIFGKKKTQN